MVELKYCQSCGMPMDSHYVLGTDKDGSLNEDYCAWCYKNGEFVDECTMEEMIEVSIKHMKESGMLERQNKTEEEAKEFMYSFFPELKRWK